MMEYNPRNSQYWHEYEQSYTYIDVAGKTILDIGADSGSSAYWFLIHGAKKVICYSGEAQILFDDRIEWHGKWRGEYVPADILKIDCEGCECNLTLPLIFRYREYYIAVHNFAGCYTFLKSFLELDGKLVFTTPDGVEMMYAKRRNRLLNFMR